MTNKAVPLMANNVAGPQWGPVQNRKKPSVLRVSDWSSEELQKGGKGWIYFCYNMRWNYALDIERNWPACVDPEDGDARLQEVPVWWLFYWIYLFTWGETASSQTLLISEFALGDF